MVVALRSKISVVRLRFTTPAFNRPKERINEDALEFGIGGNYERRRNLEQPNNNHTLIYSASFEDEEG